MIVFELEKEDIKYAEQIRDLAENGLIVEKPKSFSSNLNTIIQVGVTLAPYAIPAVALVIVEIIKNKKKIKISYSDDCITVEGEEKKALEVAKKLISQRKEDEATKILQDLLSNK